MSDDKDVKAIWPNQLHQLIREKGIEYGSKPDVQMALPTILNLSYWVNGTVAYENFQYVEVSNALLAKFAGGVSISRAKQIRQDRLFRAFVIVEAGAQGRAQLPRMSVVGTKRVCSALQARINTDNQSSEISGREKATPETGWAGNNHRVSVEKPPGGRQKATRWA